MKQANSIGFSSLFSSLAEQAPQRTSHVRVHVPAPAFDPPASSVARAIKQPKPHDESELPPMPRSSYVDEPRPALLEWGRWLLRALATHVDKSAVFDIAARALLDRAKPRENRVHGMVFLATAACWSACAFPQVTITHKLAASLMATDVPADLLPDVPLPWPAFLLVPPDGLLEIDGQPLRAICLIDGHAHMTGLPWLRAGGLLSDHRFSLYAFGSSRVWHGSADSLGELLTEPRAGSRSGGAGTLIEGRVAHMIGRLLVGALVELDAAEHRAAVQRGAPAPKIAKGREPEPRAWVFELRRDVRVDVRAYVRDYIAGTGSGHAPSVQVLVRGHRKRQVCGKGRADRRWIHVERYWRGPEDAPIALRSHKLTREE